MPPTYKVCITIWYLIRWISVSLFLSLAMLSPLARSPSEEIGQGEGGKPTEMIVLSPGNTAGGTPAISLFMYSRISYALSWS